MAAYTSTTSGNWSSNATWGGGGHPGDGDSATIADTHAVTVDVNTTVGTSGPSNTDDVICNATGSLTIAQDVKLICKGGIFTHDRGLTMNAGSWIEFTVPAGRTYTCRIGYYAQPLAHFIANGTAAKRCKISCTAAGGVATLAQNIYDGGGDTKLTYTDLENLGSAGADALYVINSCELQHCRITNCGIIHVANISATQNLDIQYCNFSAGKGGELLLVNTDSVPAALTRRVRYNAFKEGGITYSAVFQDSRGESVVGNYFSPPPLTSSYATYFITTWESNFIRDAVGALGGSQFTPLCSVIKNDYFYNETADDPLIYLPRTDAGQEFDGIVIESAVDWSIDNGDAFLDTINPASPYTYTIHNCLILPSPGRKSSTTCFTSCGGSNMTYRVYNNTYFSGAQGGAYLSDDSLGHAGAIEYFRDNIAWADVGSTNAWILWAQTTIANNYITQADYNGYVNCTAPLYNAGSNGFAATPGTHDINADPGFVDRTRALATWCSTILGKAGTPAQLRTQALAAFAAMNDESAAAYVAGLAVSDMVTWIKAGFAPTTASYATGGHAGGIVGAVAFSGPVINAQDVILRNPVTAHNVVLSTTPGINLWINLAGTYKKGAALYVNAAGTWKTMNTLEVNVAGSWKVA